MDATQDGLVQSIGLIYGAVAGSTDWSEALNALADQCGLENAALVVADRRLGLAEVITPRADPAVVAAYSDHWWALDPTIPGTINAAAGQVTSLETTGRDLYRGSEFHNDFWRRSGLGAERLASNLVTGGEAFASVVVQAGQVRDTISTNAERVFGAIVPHLIQAVQIMRRLQTLEVACAAATTAAAQNATLAIAVDGSRRPVVDEPGAEDNLRQSSVFRLRHGVLTLASPADDNRFGQLVESCAAPGLGLRGGVMQLTGAPEVELEVLPWTPPGAGDAQPLWRHPVALVILRDRAAQTRLVRQRFRDRFGLTRAETRLAFEIVAGGGREAVAERLGISLSTARTHLSRVFEKTGTRRQSELVALILGGG
ncbi:helix-turn-helix transcriptional regulator [Roseisalinus antarcticus]|uniref:HTH luxR-type domain-containing protein n=1 Tax=Roseisalinus antarcticus TaxID=254357 RepID=A0A1Y5SGG0_9RHOB|nr:helix-turn-helix transcriptional regulator [Roseisalinus antarcticus]SLN37405.1 hypothetical protein ROA7023_01400 [Roseisalinus antarcticus]